MSMTVHRNSVEGFSINHHRVENDKFKTLKSPWKIPEMFVGRPNAESDLIALLRESIMRDKNTINKLILENRRETKNLMDIIYHKNLEIEKLKGELVLQNRLHEESHKMQVLEETTSPV